MVEENPTQRRLALLNGDAKGCKREKCGKVCKKRKQKHFLFSEHNFLEKCTRSSYLTAKRLCLLLHIDISLLSILRRALHLF